MGTTRKPDTENNFLGIHFECCNIYNRIYKNKTGTAYEGKCPGCQRTIVIKIGKKGTDQRFFRAR